MKAWLHKILPDFIFNWYHWLLAVSANLLFGRPSRSLIVIGITGTSGKSTTCELLWQIVTAGGQRAGLASGIRFFDGQTSVPNNTKMTMVGRFQLQSWLAAMKRNGCRYAIIEVTSQGLKQWRHRGLNFDLVLLTNFWSEHDQAHGGFEKYKQAKGLLFSYLMKRPVKKINGQPIRKVAITNADDHYYDYFSSFPADEKLAFSLSKNGDNIVRASHLRLTKAGASFRLNEQPVKLKLLGQHNAVNALAAATAALGLGVDLATSASALEKITNLPGRLEFIDQGQDFQVIVDYAFEPKAMQMLYEVVKGLPHNRIIHVLGTTGGGRDSQRGEKLGDLVADQADYVVATDEDPYDDDPLMLIQRVVTGATNHGKELNKNLFIAEKRLDGITKGLSLATKGDIVLITGKGSEGAMCLAHGKKIPWDDRQVVRESLKNQLAEKLSTDS